MTLARTTKSPLLTQVEAGAYLNVKPQTLAEWRCTKRVDLTYVKLGRTVRYRQEDLDQFIEDQLVSQ